MLCPSCSETFERAEEVEKDLIVAFIPFHSRPWRLVWERGTDSNIEPINNCEFCTFLVALLVSNQVSGQPSEGLIPDNPNAPLKGKFKPHVSSIKSYGSPYEGHYSYRISVQRGKPNGPGPRQPLTLFRLEDPRMQSINPLSPASSNTSSQPSFERLSRWIATCTREHPSCNRVHSRPPEDSNWLPTRLIDIGPRGQETSATVRLVEEADVEATTDRRYATLSYCWGRSPSFKMLRHAEFGKFKEGIDVESLPATFKDAISATARLGLRYLWIDALCIIQDSREDWMREAATMSKVYSYTFLTLAAAASENSAGGLYRSRSPCAVNGVKLKITWPGYAEGEFYCVPDDPWLKAVHRSPLLERAWVFQERLLSSRTVYFAFDQLYWECGELYASELYPYGGPWDLEFRQKQFDVAPRLPNGIQPAEDGRFKHAYTAMFLRTPSADWTSPEEFPYIWASIVTQYSIGRLTYEKDKLMAISGVANRMAMLVGGDEYVAGLWRSSLPLLLLWHSRQRRSRPTSYQAPTWSWASLLGPVNMDFMFRAQNPPDIAIDVLKVSTTHPPGSAATGPVIDASLSVRGPLCEATATKSLRRNLTGPLSSPFYTKSLGKYEKCTMQPFRIESTLILHKKGLQTSYPSTVSFDRDPSKYSRIFCLKIATSDVRHPWGIVSMDCGLILAPTAVRGQFIRIGYFEIAPAKMRRSWRANRGLQRRDHRELEASLFKGSCVNSRFYEEFDGGDRYTITII